MCESEKFFGGMDVCCLSGRSGLSDARKTDVLWSLARALCIARSWHGRLCRSDVEEAFRKMPGGVESLYKYVITFVGQAG